MTGRPVKIALCTMLLVAPFGCNDEIWASDYDQSCSLDTDCVIVAEGDYCDRDACNCPAAAINRDDLDRWEQDLSELYRCEDWVDCECYSASVGCQEGTCTTSLE